MPNKNEVLTKKYCDSFLTFLQNTDETKKILKILENNLPNQRKSFLDIGAGSGRFAVQLRNKFKNTYVVEPNRHFFSLLKEKRMNGICVPFEKAKINEKFDFILFSHVIVFFDPSDLDKQINKMLELLTDKGKLIIIFVDDLEGTWRKLHNELYRIGNVESAHITKKIKSVLESYSPMKIKIKVDINAKDELELMDLLRFSTPRLWESNIVRTSLIQVAERYRSDSGYKLQAVEMMYILRKPKRKSKNTSMVNHKIDSFS